MTRWSICWSREERRDARRFLLERLTSRACIYDNPSVEQERLADDYLCDEIVWLAMTEDDGSLAGVYCGRPGRGEYEWQNLGAACLPKYDVRTFIWNVAVARHKLIPHEAGALSVTYADPQAPAFLAFLETPFAEGGVIDPVPDSHLVRAAFPRPAVIPDYVTLMPDLGVIVGGLGGPTP